jgi:hypothetical protein
LKAVGANLKKRGLTLDEKAGLQESYADIIIALEALI